MSVPEENQLDNLFAKLGRRLRAAREERGVPLKEISDRTRIQINFLQQIEAGSLEGLPDFVFVRGFIRNYAQALGINDSIIKDDLRRIIELEEKTPTPSSQAGFKEERLYDTEPQKSIWPLLLMLGVLVLVLGWTMYVFLVPD